MTATPSESPPSRDQPGLRDLLPYVWQSVPLILFGLVVGIGLGLFLQSVTPRAYEAKAKFVIGELPYYNQSGPLDPATERQLIQTLIMSIPSREMSRAIETRLNVAPAQLAFTDLDIKKKLTGSLPEANIRVDVVRETRLGEISVTSQDSDFAARVVNSILDELQLYNLIGGKLKNLQLRIGFARTRAEGSLKQLVDISAQRIKLERENVELDAHLARGLPLASFPTFSTDATLNNLKTQLVLVETDLDRITATATRGAQLIGGRAEAAGLRAQLDANVNALAGALRAEFQIVKTQEADLSRQVKNAQNDLDTMSNRAAVLSQSLSDPAAMREIAAAPTDEPTGPANVIVTIDRATPNKKPIQPKLWLNLLLGFVFGCALGGGLASLRILLDNRVRSPRQISRRTGLPVLAILPNHVPLFRGIKHGSIFDHPEYPVGLGRLRSELIRSREEHQTGQVIGFSGMGRRTYVSDLVASLAILLAQAERRTLVVDLHVNAPRQARKLGISPRKGLKDWLATDEPLSSFISYSVVRELAVLHPGEPNRDMDDLLSRRPLLAELPRLLGDWDFILVDAPGVMNDWSLTLALAPEAPLILVADYARTNIEEILLTIDRAREQRWQISGVVMQQCPARMSPAAPRKKYRPPK